MSFDIIKHKTRLRVRSAKSCIAMRTTLQEQASLEEGAQICTGWRGAPKRVGAHVRDLFVPVLPLMGVQLAILPTPQWVPTRAPCLVGVVRAREELAKNNRTVVAENAAKPHTCHPPSLPLSLSRPPLRVRDVRRAPGAGGFGSSPFAHSHHPGPRRLADPPAPLTRPLLQVVVAAGTG